MKNILSLNFEEAKTFFLKHESYINVDLPPYIKLENLLEEANKVLVRKNFISIKKVVQTI